MRATIRIVGIFLGCVLGFASAAYGRPAAIVTDIEGRATLLRGSQPVPVALLTEIGDDEVVELAGGTRLVVIHYWPGHEYTLKGPGKVRVGFGSLEALSGTPPERREVRTRVRVNPSGLVQAGVQMRGGLQSPIRLLHPVGIRLLETQPEFRWEMLVADLEYSFSLSSDSGVILYEVRTREVRVALPASVRLAAGARYAWRVTAKTSQGQERTAIAGFTTASPELAEEVRRTRPTDQAEVSDLVAYALWLRQERLQGEADRYWQLIKERRPGDAGMAGMVETLGDRGNR